MPSNITDVDTFTDPIVGPADADPADRTYLMTGLQGLANRTRRLVNMLGGSGAATVERTIYVGPTAFRTAASQGIFAYVLLNQNDQPAFADVADFLPSGAILKSVHVLVKPGFARGAGDAMLFKLFRQQMTAFPGADPTATQLGGDDEDDGSNGRQLVGVSGLAETIDRDVNAITVQLQAGNDAGTGGREDRIYGLKLVFDDVGPRAW